MQTQKNIVTDDFVVPMGIQSTFHGSISSQLILNYSVGICTLGRQNHN